MTQAETRLGGKAVVVENGGQPFTVSIKEQVGFSGLSGDWQTIADEIDLRTSQDSGQAPWSRGHVVVGGAVLDTTSEPAHTFVYLEVEVIGKLGAVSTVLATVALGGGKQNARVDVDKPYEKITFRARQVSDVPNVFPNSITFNASGRFWR
jgi:hypothetical protein